MIVHRPPEWMFYNPITKTIDTQDGTAIGIEHFSSSFGTFKDWGEYSPFIHGWAVPDSSCRPTDALTLAIMRDEQRQAIKARKETP